MQFVFVGVYDGFCGLVVGAHGGMCGSGSGL